VNSVSHECGQRHFERTALSSSVITDVKCESEDIDDKGEDDVLRDLLSRHMNEVDARLSADADEVVRLCSYTSKGTPGNQIQTHADDRLYMSTETFEKSFVQYLHLQALSEDNPQICPVYCKRCTLRSGLQTHMAIPSGDGLHKCDVCHKQFSPRSHLNSHVVIHSGKRSHVCSVCHKQFTQRSSLNRHMVVHNGERPHACNVCHKKFKQRGVLKNHMLTHTGEKPYKCDVCHKQFTQCNSLKRHLLTHTAQGHTNVVYC